MSLDPRRALVSLAAGAAVAFAVPSLALAEGVGAATPTSAGVVRQDVAEGAEEPVSDEVAFMRTAVSDSATEIEAGRLALERAGSEEVREFAETMVREHQARMQEAARLAASHGVVAPQAPTDDDETDLIAALSSSSGREFDETYLRAFVHDQRVTIEDYQAARSDMASDIADYAERQLPMLEEQLQDAEELANRLGVVLDESGATTAGGE